MTDQPENPLTTSLLREWRMLENSDGAPAATPEEPVAVAELATPAEPAAAPEPVAAPVAAKDPSATLSLAEVLDLKAAVPLASELLALRGGPVTVDASRVQRIGGLCLQVLLSARATWAEDHAALSIVNPSAAFSEDITLLGAASLISPQA